MISILLCTNNAELVPGPAAIKPPQADLRIAVRSPVPGTADPGLAGADLVIVLSAGSGTEGIDLLRSAGHGVDNTGLVIVAKSCDPAIAYEALMNGAGYYILQGSPGEFAYGLSRVIEKSADAIRVKRTLDALSKKLNFVGSVTRHDVLNQLTAVGGYNELLAMMVQDPKLKGFIEKERSALEKIRRQFQFAKDYQNIGMEPPEWHPIRAVVGRMNELVDPGNVRVTVATGTAVVLADPLFEKVFYNLFDNSLRHGVRVTEIRVSLREEPTGAVLTVEDDGVGIPVEEKMKIFERGYGKNTGWGLFLIREILTVTGMTVEETGEPGKGARFEIRIPKENYRPGSEPSP